MKRIFVKSLLSILLLTCAATTFAQREISIGDYLSPTYAPMLINKKTDLRASPFLSPDWLVGEVVLDDGKTYQNVKFNYDQSSESLVIEVNGNTYAPNRQVKKFTYTDGTDTVIFKNGYLPEDQTLFQVLYEGNTILLKHTKKSKIQREDHFTGNTEINFVPRTDYYLVKDNRLQKVSPTEKGVLGALADKKPALKSYVDEHDANLKDDRVLANIISYYDSL